MYENNKYTSKDFINKHVKDIEWDILQLDHLTEKEQRERGMLKDDEIYIPKKQMVSKLSSLSAMKLEALKCQLLCVKCHLKETISRESGRYILSKSHAERDKLSIVNELKLTGCSICGYMNTDLPRFFYFDHIDPSLKTKEISRMVK